jgi:hypothetical protein
MRRVVLPATILSLALVSAAWAVPVPLTTTQQVKSPHIVDVGYKGDKKKLQKQKLEVWQQVSPQEQVRWPLLARREILGSPVQLSAIWMADAWLRGRRTDLVLSISAQSERKQ